MIKLKMNFVLLQINFKNNIYILLNKLKIIHLHGLISISDASPLSQSTIQPKNTYGKSIDGTDKNN